MCLQDRRLDDEQVARRPFLLGMIGTLATLIGGTITASVGKYLIGTPKSEGTGWADAGEVGTLKPGKPQEIHFSQARLDGWRVRNEKVYAWVTTAKDGSLTAFSPQCTHLGCAYKWQDGKNAFVCPCHGSVFDASGKVLSGPANRPLDRYPVKLEGNRLWLGPVQTTVDS